MPFSFSSEDGGPSRPPTVTFKNAEDLRYQNDYYELPEPDDFQLQNEIFQDFDAPKIKPGKSDHDYFPKPQKKIKYSEGLSYRNPLDKYHNKMDVEIFEVPSSPFTIEDISYSNYKSNPHFVDLAGPAKPSRSEALYKPRRQETREEADDTYFHNNIESDLPENFYDIPKIPADNFDEHVFSLPDVAVNNHYQTGPASQHHHYDSHGQTYKRETSDFVNYNDIDYKDYDDYEYKERPDYEYKERPDYDYKERPDYDNKERPDYDYKERPDYEYKERPEYKYKERPEYEEYAVPDPLPPPPAIIEMQHDSVFAGNFDVPKLGVATDYKPPELLYNEMFQKSENSFSNLLPDSDKHSRSLQYTVTPSPFLPTPSRPRKALADYSHLYQSKRHEETEIPPYVAASPTPRHKQSGDSKANYYKHSENTKRNYFKPRSSPSLTFETEPEYSNEIFDEDRELYEKLHGGSGGFGQDFLHAVAQHEPEYEEYEADIARGNYPVRPERVVTPQSSSYQREDLRGDVAGPPRYKRYQSVDYTPQQNVDYNNLFRSPPQPYKSEPFLPYPEPTPAYSTPAPFIQDYPPPTPAPEYFKHQLPEFPPPEIFPHSEPEVRTPDYYGGSDYGSDYNYNSPSYKTYELDSYEPNYHESFSNIDIPKLGPGGSSHWNNDLATQTGNYNQFVNVAGPEAFEHGHVRGNPEHKKQEYSRREGRHFKSQVSLNKVAAI